MPLHKLTADFDDRDLAMTAAGILQNLIDPAPDALTIFESGPGGWRLEAYFNEDLGVRDIAAELRALTDIALPPMVRANVPDLNWVALSQAALPPVVAGRFTVHGSHDRGRIPHGPNGILIDAGEAFGTAHHATTLGCLMAIDRLTRNEAFETVLDLGTGSGVLAIAVAKAQPSALIVATDLDARSIEVARDNATINGVGKRIAFACAHGLRHTWIRQSPRFDFVIANILAGPLLQLAPGLARVVAPGGALVLSGLLIPQAPPVIARYRSAGFHVERHDRIIGWSTLTLRRRS